MTKAKTADTRDEPKTLETIEELVKGIDQFKSLLKPVEDLKREGNPYKDAERAKTEFQLKDAIRDVFGEDSAEYQQYKNFRMKVATKADINQALSLIQNLIDYLEDKKLDVGGKRPKAAPKPADIKPVLTPKPLPPPVIPKPIVVPAPPPPIAAMPPPEVTTPPPPVRPPDPSPPEAVIPSPPPPLISVPPAPSAPPAPPETFIPPVVAAKIAPPPAPPKPAATPTPPVPSMPPSTAPSAPAAKSPPPASAKADIIALLRKIGTRFHAVARQLRLRHEERTALEIEDEYDVQDVVHALLCLEFDDIDQETWSPDYAKGATRTDFMLPREKIVIEVKKTRPGLGAKELTKQLDADMQYYWTSEGCQTLFCFVYDPEGRLGDPQGLEKKLTREIDGKKLEVLISPK